MRDFHLLLVSSLFRLLIHYPDWMLDNWHYYYDVRWLEAWRHGRNNGGMIMQIFWQLAAARPSYDRTPGQEINCIWACSVWILKQSIFMCGNDQLHCAEPKHQRKTDDVGLGLERHFCRLSICFGLGFHSLLVTLLMKYVQYETPVSLDQLWIWV